MNAPTDTPETTSRADERYGAIETGSGETIIYDRELPDAWVQSDYLLEFEA